MKSPLASLGLVCILSAALPRAAAHDTIPSDWCPVGYAPAIVSEFALSPEQLQQYRRTHEKQRYDGCLQQKTCGIIDEWFWAQEAAGEHCSAIGLRAAVPEDAIPFVNAPKSFNVADHHLQYDFTDGTLRGQCAVCRSSTSREPVPAAGESPDTLTP